jgi:chromosome segregation ATPase
LTGCGVPQEKHDALVAQLTADREASEAALNGKITDLESLLKSEKAKTQSLRLQLDDATEQCKVLRQQSAETASELADEKSKTLSMEQEVADAKLGEIVAQDLAREAEEKYNALKDEFDALQRRFEMFKTNLQGFGKPASAVAPKAAAPAASPEAESKSSLDILNEMGSK